MKLEIRVYSSLPCEDEVFTINGIEASKDDFGEVNVEGIGNYSCLLMGFTPKMPKQGVLDKYKITLDEYEEIIEQLNDTFCYGKCSWCV
nr:MAG TPA: Golgin subfamily A member 7/ERF4 family [Caudoviricetes sp.]DAX62841.1 MAG TPA: Golgin subfamily A member 7/ERF4 family [Caudoviricetes sp.]